jgi:hypothetical protein
MPTETTDRLHTEGTDGPEGAPMVMIEIRSIAAVIAAGLCALPSAHAQPTRTQDGRRLDASLRLGSGGVNTPVSAPRGFGSQLYVNGQVTGLAGFRGKTGYSASNSLRLALPSERMRDFRQQSVGLSGALSGGTFRTTPYFSRTSTVFGARGILAGRTAPGSNIPRTSSGASAVANKLYEEARAAYGPLSNTRVQQMGPLGGPLGAPLGPRSGFRPVPSLPGGVLGGLSRPGASNLFSARGGLGTGAVDPHAIRRGAAAGALGQGLPGTPALPSGVTPGRPGGPGRVGPNPIGTGPAGLDVPQPPNTAAAPGLETTPGGPVAPAVPGLRPGESPSRTLSPLAGRMKLSAATGRLEGPKLKSPDRRVGPGHLPRRGQDVFVDLLVALKSRRAADRGSDPARVGSVAKPIPILRPRRPLAPGEKPPADPTDMSVADWRTGRKRLDYSEPAEGETPPGAEFVQLTKDQQIQVNALAGAGADQFNLRMGSAQEKLKAGRYYDAAADFEAASAIDPKNPLARVGVCLSLFCAGEPLTAANYLRRAMGEFPPLMEARISIRRIAPSNALRWQLERLRKRLKVPAEARKPMMVFLATFMHLNQGQESAAKEYAATLKSLTPNDRLLQAYAAHVLTGKSPAKQPSPR